MVGSLLPVGGVCRPCWNVDEPTEGDADRGYVGADRPQALHSDVEWRNRVSLDSAAKRWPTSMTCPLTGAAWPTAPSACIVCGEDPAAMLFRRGLGERAPADWKTALGPLVAPVAAGGIGPLPSGMKPPGHRRNPGPLAREA